MTENCGSKGLYGLVALTTCLLCVHVVDCSNLPPPSWGFEPYPRPDSVRQDQQEPNLGYNAHNNAMCDRMAKQRSEVEQQVQELGLEDNIEGTWVSSRCEVRPGPEFLVRRYTFGPEHNMSNSSSSRLDVILHQFHYEDHECRRPIYGIKARAWLDVKLAHKSWIVPGAMEIDEINIDSIDVMPFTIESAKQMQRSIYEACPHLSMSVPWKVYERHEVFKSVAKNLFLTRMSHFLQDLGTMPEDILKDNLDCLQRLDISFTELQLIRLERRLSRQNKWRTEMLLGDIHTEKAERARYRPTAYQPYGLFKGEKIHGCKACREVFSASNLSDPPLLPSRPFVPVSPSGEWLSQRNWHGSYHYYADEHCANKPIFSIIANGIYLQDGLSRHVDGGTDFEFKIKEAVVSVYTNALALQLNSSPPGTCGRTGAWRKGVPMDVTPTGGCKALGLKIPLLEHDLLKMETSHHGSNLILYLGQTQTRSQQGKLHPRPTSYQPGLIQCHSEPGFHIISNELFPTVEMARLTSSTSKILPAMLINLFATTLTALRT